MTDAANEAPQPREEVAEMMTSRSTMVTLSGIAVPPERRLTMSRRNDQYNRKVEAIIQELMNNLDAADINKIVWAINAKIMFAVFADNAAHHHRLDAGRMLLVLRRRIEAEGKDWWKFHADHIDRSRRDSEKLLAMASADDPEQAAKEAAGENAKHQAAHRSRITAAYVSRSDPIRELAQEQNATTNQKKVGEFFHELTDTLNDYCARLEVFLEANPGLNDECRGGLIQVLEVNSMRLQQLAQHIDGR